MNRETLTEALHMMVGKPGWPVDEWDELVMGAAQAYRGLLPDEDGNWPDELVERVGIVVGQTIGGDEIEEALEVDRQVARAVLAAITERTNE